MKFVLVAMFCLMMTTTYAQRTKTADRKEDKRDRRENRRDRKH
jgi:hypothetical protein